MTNDEQGEAETAPGEAEPDEAEPDEAAAQLEEFRRAVHDLYEASLPDELVAGAGVSRRVGGPVGVADAARSLGAQREVDRLFKLHAVASALTRNPDLAEGPEARSGLADALVPGGPGEDGGDESGEGGDGRTGERLAAGLRRFAARVRDRPGGLTPSRWREFVDLVEEPESADRPVSLVGKPGCNDEELVPTPSGHARTIRSRFWTHLPLSDASEFIDPMCWTIYGRPFWKRMAMVQGTHEPFTTTVSDGYTAVFEEIVDLPFMGEVRVFLWVRYERSGDHVSVDYQVAGPPYPNDQVTFDSGWVYATSPTVGPNGEATYVDGLKSIRFRDPAYNAVPDLACDGGWVHFMINMALAGRGLPGGARTVGPATVPPPAGVSPLRGGPAGGGPQRPGPGPAPPDEVVRNVGALVGGWAGATAGTLQDQARTATTAVGRVLSPRPDPRWVNDLLGMGQVAIDATEATVATWRRVLVELARMGEERR